MNTALSNSVNISLALLSNELGQVASAWNTDVQNYIHASFSHKLKNKGVLLVKRVYVTPYKVEEMLLCQHLKRKAHYMCTFTNSCIVTKASPAVCLGVGDLLQPLLQHEEFSDISLLGLCGQLLVVSSQARHLLLVALLQMELLLLRLGPQLL